MSQQAAEASPMRRTRKLRTRCRHYFCQSCALNRYRKDPTCAACGTGTNGVFNKATKLPKLLALRRSAQDETSD
ncbi:hypothetical protein B0I35DRAFT_421266, partial [Stachybotrys elegans]